MLGDQGTFYALFIYFFRYLIDFRRKKKSILANISRLEKYFGQELKESYPK